MTQHNQTKRLDNGVRMSRGCAWLVRAFLFGCLLLTIPSRAWAQAPVITTPTNSTFSVGVVEIPLTTSSGAATWSVLDPANLPPGLAVRTDLASWFPPSAFAGLVGVATTPGSYTFQLQATNASGTTTQFTTVKISTLWIKDYWTLPDAFVGHFYSYTMTPLNNSGVATWTVVLPPFGNPLPPGFALSSA